MYKEISQEYRKDDKAVYVKRNIYLVSYIQHGIEKLLYAKKLKI